MTTIKQFVLLAIIALLPLTGFAQTGGFGQNKPHYENFEFDVYQSPSFELYTYINDADWRQQFLNDAEEWMRVHRLVLRDTIKFRNPLIIYNNHADFQQTNAISGRISTGTGGVTEAFKNRVIMPVAHSNQQTHHVLGHELVHAYQYNMIINGEETSLRDLGNLPLWMVEGLAEYLSIGSVDPFTAMWMRDAVLNDDVPTIKQLSGSKYFPYRYGQAWWSFVTGLYGDNIIAPYFKQTAQFGLEESTKRVLGVPLSKLNELWQQSLTKTYGEQIAGAKADRLLGTELVANGNNGTKMNVAPEVSPNGRYLIYLGQSDLFSVDLILADARTGERIRKIRTSTVSGHIDDMNYIENSGTWSPDSKQFAYTVVAKGRTALIVADVEKGKATRKIFPEGLQAFTGPAWRPDGKSVVVSGLKDGRSDLWLIDLRSEQATRLTDDDYSEMHPAWSADGSTLYYATDRVTMTTLGRTHGKLRFNLATLDVETGATNDLPVFPGADNLNPIEGADGQIYFLSNRDGFRNLYRFDPTTNSVEQLTDLITGVSGITHYAPAMSMDRSRNRLVYTYFSQQGYRLQSVLTDRLEGTEVDMTEVDLTPARLPRLNPQAPQVVDQLLTNMDRVDVIEPGQISEQEYKPNFRLDYITGTAGAGVGTNPIFGTNAGAAGGVQAIFSDVLGDNQIFGGAQLNGEFTDFGGSLGWLNRKHRVQYGITGGRVPFRSFGLLEPRLEDLQLDDDLTVRVGNAPYLIQRIYQNTLTGFAQLPISTKLRLEGSLNGSYYTNRVDQYNRYFDPNTGRPVTIGFQQRPERQRDLESEAFFLGRGGVAVVGDNSRFGLTAPILGYRYRFGVERFFGEFAFNSVTADYRRYLRLPKMTLALRALHQGRYGGNGNELFPLYVGSPWYMRGLQGNDVVADLAAGGRSINELIGSKVIVANAEFRIPFTGPKPLALIKSGVLFSDLNFFIDGGVAFTSFDQFDGPTFTLDENGEPFINPETGEPFVASPGVTPIFTAGVSTRVNVFGQIVLEPFLARPLMDGGRWSFGLNFIPGW